MKKILKELMREIEDFYSNEQLHIFDDITVNELRDHLKKYDFTRGKARIDIFDDVTAMLRKWTLYVTSPHYFGLFNPSVTIDSIIADTLVGLYNPQLAVWAHAPAANEIEQHVLKFIGRFIYDNDDFFACFTSGGSEANMTAVIAALAFKIEHFAANGFIPNESRPLIYISEHAHHSFEKISKSVGLGERSIRRIPASAHFRMNLNALEKQYQKDLASDRHPFMIVGTAGTTSFGSVDPLEELSGFCETHDLWFHVDAAWGGAARLSPKLSPHLNGIENADSVIVDAHKWLSVGMGAGMFCTKHLHPVTKAFGISADYVPDSPHSGIIEPYLTTIQWSRRFIGLKLFMTLARLGSDGIACRIEKQTGMGDYLKATLSQKGWRIINDTPLPVVCFTHKAISRGNISTDELLDAINREGKYWISDVTVAQDKKAFRACITSFKTEKHHIDEMVEDLTDKIS